MIVTKEIEYSDKKSCPSATLIYHTSHTDLGSNPGLCDDSAGFLA